MVRLDADACLRVELLTCCLLTVHAIEPEGEENLRFTQQLSNATALAVDNLQCAHVAGPAAARAGHHKEPVE